MQQESSPTPPAPSYLGPPWAADAIGRWLRGERATAIAQVLHVSPQRVGQVLKANGVRRAWVPIESLNHYVGYEQVTRWAKAGRIRRHEESGLVIETEVLDLVVSLMHRECDSLECQNYVYSLRDDARYCADCTELRAR